MLAWHVAQTHDCFVAEENLLRQDFEVFNPKCRTRKIVKGMVREYVRAYIPGYIFIRFDELEDQWRPINWTRGVKTVMYSVEEKPARVRDEAMAPLLAICNDGFLIQEDADLELYKVGRRIKVIDGTFEGFESSIVWSSGQRLAVMMEFFGATRRVELQKKQVELIF